MKSFFRPLRNDRGDALIIAMIMVAVSLTSVFVIMNFTQQVHATSKNPRVKSMMTALEAKVRAHMMNPSSYTNCDAAIGRSSCMLIASDVTALGRHIPEAQCPPTNPNCGLEVIHTFDQPTSTANVTIRYTGLDLRLKDIKFTVTVPADIIQQVDARGIYKCPQTAPKFVKINPDGTLDCQALPARAAPGEVVTAINPVDLTVTKMALPAVADCGVNNVVQTVNWGAGGTAFSFTCGPRLNPNTTFGFTPKPSPGGNVTYMPNPDYP